METLHISLFGGPGTGKSTTAAGLFHQMKTDGERVELITEFAKDLVYKEDYLQLGNQLSLLAEQKNRNRVLQGKVDYTITDSPFVMGLTYLADDPHIPQKEFKALALAMYETFNTLNVFLVRDNDAHPYQEYGRNQKLHEAEEKDKEIRALLDDNDIPYVTATVGPGLIVHLLELIEERK